MSKPRPTFEAAKDALHELYDWNEMGVTSVVKDDLVVTTDEEFELYKRQVNRHLNILAAWFQDQTFILENASTDIYYVCSTTGEVVVQRHESYY